MFRFNITPVVKQIVIACVLLFALTYLLKLKGILNLDHFLAMYYPNNPDFRPWQIITHMFMHGGWMHLGFNMLALATIGSTVESFTGGKKFLQLYFISGIGAIAVHFIAQLVDLYMTTGLVFPVLGQTGIVVEGDYLRSTNAIIESKEELKSVYAIIASPIVGASGAIYGVVTAFAFLFPNTQLVFLLIPYPIKAKYLVPAIIGIDLIFGISNFQWDPIAHFAHIGGAIFGLALVYYWRKFDRRNFY